ncbi:unnamed protein product [Tetraodon nigroviridis]|uniref:(spotted green pufferfish) hypothetical protein n=1 Tax=Tetraodon nigroviridis TaxID=99883 RepID=Q4SG26_TETNG|nr:unnamed protein product [Tetraodon nigroviridis]
MKLKLQTATRAEERSTQKQPTQLNMVAARGRKPAKRPKSTPKLTSSSFFSLPRSECIWSSRLQERDFNLVRSSRAALSESRASGCSARNCPKHMSQVSINSSHTPLSCFAAARRTWRPTQAPQSREGAGGKSVRAADTNTSRSRQPPPLCSSSGAGCHWLRSAALPQARLHVVKVAGVK